MSKRHFEAGAWSHDGKAMRLVDLHRVTLVGCSGGGCNQGRSPDGCDCEFSASIAPDAYRVIQPPIPAPEPNHRTTEPLRLAGRWLLWQRAICCWSCS
jgi:hypothetical protein